MRAISCCARSHGAHRRATSRHHVVFAVFGDHRARLCSSSKAAMQCPERHKWFSFAPTRLTNLTIVLVYWPKGAYRRQSNAVGRRGEKHRRELQNKANRECPRLVGRQERGQRSGSAAGGGRGGDGEGRAARAAEETSTQFFHTVPMWRLQEANININHWGHGCMG